LLAKPSAELIRPQNWARIFGTPELSEDYESA